MFEYMRNNTFRANTRIGAVAAVAATAPMLVLELTPVDVCRFFVTT